MQTAILADIHGNLMALDAVLRDIHYRSGMDQIWSLGDIVDYGPEPQKCLERMRQSGIINIAGNHEYAIVDKMDLSQFQPAVAPVTRWTKEQLHDDDILYLKGLPLTLEILDFTLAHGSPRDPVWEYILSEVEAKQNLNHFRTHYCLVGHTHVPLCFQFPKRVETEQENGSPGNSISLSRWEQLIRENRRQENVIQLTDDRFIINPGSVGQPRDNDPRAAYAIFNSQGNTLELRRVEYDIAATQRRMAELNLPEWLSSRLAKGK